MRVVGSRKVGKLPRDRKRADRLSSRSYRLQSGGSSGSLCKDNHRVEDQINSLFSSLHSDLDNTAIEGVEGISVKRIKGEVHEQKD